VEDNLFGQILLNNHFIEKPDLERCLELQHGSDKPKMLGEILIQEGYITKSILNSILSIQRRRVDLTKETKRKVGRSEIAKRLKETDLFGFLTLVKDIGASDLYFTTNARPIIRVHGNLVDLDYPPFDSADVQEIVFQALAPEEQAAFLKSHDFEISLTLEKKGRCRLNIFKDYYGYGAFFRMFPERVTTLEEIGYPRVMRDFAAINRGLVLITGPISSGKSTTMNALVEEINQRRKGHIVTIENPIEVVFESKGCIVTQREVGRHTKSFPIALRAALREDPDFIVISELKDLETIQTALQAAETGHLVIGTLPTASAVRTLHRIVDVFPEAQQAQIRGMLSGTLKAIVSQQLIPNMDGKGRSLAQEILITNPAVSNFIRESRVYQIPSAIQLGREFGMKLMDDSLMELVRLKKIAVEEAFVRAENKERFVNLTLEK
jgi:twitching motility protein PilT